MNSRRNRRRLVRYGILAFNVLLLAAIGVFVVEAPSPGTAVTPTKPQVANAVSADQPGPLDQLSSVDIALTAARLSGLPEATAINNQADSQRIQFAMLNGSGELATKPQVVATSFKSNKDIKTYTVQGGDTISSIAAKFHVTSDSIRWSNNLTGESIAVGTKLYIPPMNGIVYVVKSGDTPASLADKYDARKDLIVSYNDAELHGLKPGERVIIPNGRVEAPAPPVYTAYQSYYSGLAWGGSPIYGYNGYDFGNCTWYVANRVSIPANWGNANTWDDSARASGWIVSPVPRVGAIAQTDGMSYLGHVAYVEAVSADGTQIKYSDMNNYADGGGFDRVGHSGWEPVSTFPNYIYR